jgi:hypothetical protein
MRSNLIRALVTTTAVVGIATGSLAGANASFAASAPTTTATATASAHAVAPLAAKPQSSHQPSFRPSFYSCNHVGLSGVCAYTTKAITFYVRDGGSWQLPAGTLIEVECWYPGSSTDGYWDHVVWVQPWGMVQGHVDDNWVDFGGQFPKALVPQCG